MLRSPVRSVWHDDRLDFFLLADRWDGEVRNREPEKCGELRWVPIDHLPENTVPYIASAIEAWRRGAWFSEFGWE